jgi:hypothetical protein
VLVFVALASGALLIGRLTPIAATLNLIPAEPKALWVKPSTVKPPTVRRSTFANFDLQGDQVVRYDTADDPVDAHDGKIALFNGIYYLYGTSYDCGYGLRVPRTKFCGFKVYQSPDLVQWTYDGYLFDATGPVWQSRCAPPAYGCYRPHVVYNATTGAYVLWINSYDNRSGYHVFTSPYPTGPFIEMTEPTLAVQGRHSGFNNGDMDVFVDDDGVAYLAYTDVHGNHDQIVERLDTAYTSGTGSYTRLGATGTEAPALFRRGSVYYYLNGPACEYCGGTPTQYRMSTNGPLGPWSPASVLNPNSCGGQPSFVARLGSVYLYASDLWHAGSANQRLANYYWAPLTFATNGTIDPIVCAAIVSVTLD